MKLVTLLFCVNLIQAFKISEFGYEGSPSLTNMSNQIRKSNNRFSRCLRFFQLSKTFNFNHCREIKEMGMRTEIPIGSPMKTERNEVRRFKTWTKYHTFD